MTRQMRKHARSVPCAVLQMLSPTRQPVSLIACDLGLSRHQIINAVCYIRNEWGIEVETITDRRDTWYRVSPTTHSKILSLFEFEPAIAAVED